MAAIHPIIVAVAVMVVSMPLTGAAEPFRQSTCGGGSYDPANSAYQANLAFLAAAFPANASAGFATASVGAAPSQVTALALCRGDANATTCRSCVAEAFPGAQQDCPGTKDVTIYQDACVVRFSGQRFLDYVGLNSPYAVFHSDDAADNVTAAINAAIAALINATADLAVASSDSAMAGRKYFATGVADAGAAEKVYGLVQCAPDMTASQCRGCLSGIWASVPFFLNGTLCGRSLGVWCNLRYCVRPFYTGLPMLHISTVVLVPSTTTTPETTGTGAAGRKKLGISVGIVLLIVISSAVALIRYKRGKTTKNDSWLKKMAGGECTIFDFLTLQEATENFSEEHKLGEGGYGIVFKGKLPDGQDIAVKKLLDCTTGHGLDQLRNEVQVLATLQHRNLVRLQGFCVHQNVFLVVYEYINNGSLDNFVFEDTRKENKLSWDQQYNIIVGIAKGIMYLHEDSRRKIIHRDLKANNILLDDDMEPKIADFGLARLIGDHTRTFTATVAGTYGYMAPEYALNGNVSPKIDIFSFGVLVLEIVTRRRNSSSDDCSNVNLLSDVWNCWTKGMISQMIDQTLEGYSQTQALRCIHPI